MIKTIGKTYINGTQFTTDPKIERSWPSRQTVLAGLELAVTVQDFGRTMKDKVLTLTSNGNYINASFKAAVDALAGTRGNSYSYSDYTGLEGFVKILRFDAQPTFIRDNDLVLYEYTLVLKVMSLTLMDGVAYSGD